MKTAERENPNRRPQCVANRADGADRQYRSCSIMWAAKQENFQPAEKCFFLTSPFIELTGSYPASTAGLVLVSLVRKSRADEMGVHREQSANQEALLPVCPFGRSRPAADATHERAEQ